MQAVLYVAHGTRVKEGIEQAIQFIERTKADVHAPIQQICFLELAEPDIVQGIQNCVQKGATSVAVVPILLLTAQHANEDIPQELEKARAIFPSVPIRYGRPFGVHDKLVDSLYARIMEANQDIDSEAEVLLIGRGSSDLAVMYDLGEIANKLKSKYSFKKVDTCFLYGKGRPFAETLEDLKNRNVNQVFIVPYLLFSGMLRKNIVKKMEQQDFDTSRVVLCESLGYGENVRQVLLERVNELLHAKNSLNDINNVSLVV